MFISASLFYGSSVEKVGWKLSLTFARLFAGICYGMVYVTVFVQTSDNATKEFRQTMVIIIGGVIALSIVFASLCVVNIKIIFETAIKEIDLKNMEVTSAYAIFVTTLFLCFISVVINYLYTHESVSFLLKHNCRDDEAVYVLAKLQGETMDSVVIQHDFDAIQKMCENDYLEYAERKIFTKTNRKLMMFAMCGRLTGVLSFSVPVIVTLTQFLREDILESINKKHSDNSSRALAELASDQERYQSSVKTVLFIWFVVGYSITIASNICNWKRAFDRVVFITGIIIAFLTVLTPAHKSFDWILNFFFIVYFKILSLPVDINGYAYLAECFPIPTKSWSIGYVTIVENFVHILLILGDWEPGHFHFEFFVIGLVLAITGFKLYVTAPTTKDLSVSEAQQLYLESTFNSEVDIFTRAIGRGISVFRH